MDGFSDERGPGGVAMETKRLGVQGNGRAVGGDDTGLLDDAKGLLCGLQWISEQGIAKFKIRKDRADKAA